VALGRVRATRGDAPDLLAASADRQDVVVLRPSGAVQPCLDISVHLRFASDHPVPTTVGDAFSGLARRGVFDEVLAQQ